MHLRKFLYCWPLKYGVITVGLAFGLTDFIVGSIGWNMVIRNKYPDYVVEFFRTMDTRICVSGFATVFWLMMTDHFLLIYAVFYHKLLIIGTWLLINYMVFLFTLVTVLLDSLLILRIIALGYCLIVVKSYYSELAEAQEEPSDSSVESTSDQTSD
ncbi:uncharacterized protein LOC6734038 [Drosophila simulans]|uniref:Uncharacterized protein n=1 Tax=Drosophila simulans TaxID=7240 RepID=A0A0J9RAJ8_DROSI|nr:uncharacterized protein LOC6734038 [Drosophila simulans]KMY93037.1 uncharacterized protein Dsimw501_GD10813 [Drosophila simulans]